MDIRFLHAKPQKGAIFNEPVKALAHVCDHVLTRDETWSWYLYLGCLYPYAWMAAGDKLRWRFAQSLWDDHTPAAAQRWYDEYATEIRRGWTEALTLGWWFDDGIEQWFLGLTGLLVVLKSGDVVTAYFRQPYRVNRQASHEQYSIAARRQEPLPRERDQPFLGWQPEVGARSRKKVFDRTLLKFSYRYERVLADGWLTDAGAGAKSRSVGHQWDDEWKKHR